MGKVIGTEKLICPFCNHEYTHNIYADYKGTGSICPSCHKRSDAHEKDRGRFIVNEKGINKVAIREVIKEARAIDYDYSYEDYFFSHKPKTISLDKEKRNKRERERWATDPEYRKKIMERNKRYVRRVSKQKGRPKIVYSMCKDIDLSDEVSKAMSMDEYSLDKEMMKRGLLRKNKFPDYWRGEY